MAIKISSPSHRTILEASDLSQDAFSSFGTVIENPAPALIPTPKIKKLPANAVQANQGSALKYLDVANMRDLYSESKSKEKAEAVMNMFVCAPRTLVPSKEDAVVEGFFPVEVLERHPFTTQTFIPMGLSRLEQKKARYLVIVAPSLEPSRTDEDLPVPSSRRGTEARDRLPGRGLPDLAKVKTFVANGSQAVTYGAGTWHAPMVVVGETPIDFVVVQFANGVAIEDCQEVELENRSNGELLVAVPAVKARPPLAKL